MPTLKAEDIPDLVYGTLEKYGKPKFSQIAQKLTEYEVMPRWFKKDKVVVDSGYGIRESLMTKLSGSWRHVGLFERDSVNVVDLMSQINLRWAHGTANYAFEYREVLMNSGAQQIYKLLNPRRGACMLDVAQGLEDDAFTLPAVGDKKSPYGVPYWIVSSETQGFNGKRPSGYTTVGGIDPDSVEGWRNWTDAYVSRVKADVIRRMRKAKRNTKWKSPVNVKDARDPNVNRYSVYCNENVISDLEELGENQNENLGRDLGAGTSNITFKGHPIIYLPVLDSRTDDPIYMLNHDTFYPVVLKGDWLRESKPKALDGSPDGQHNTFVTHIDCSYNYLCIDRRRNAVIVKKAA